MTFASAGHIILTPIPTSREWAAEAEIKSTTSNTELYSLRTELSYPHAKEEEEEEMAHLP